ncbi:unnamed protein product, partial [Owenia fusiformis]
TGLGTTAPRLPNSKNSDESKLHRALLKDYDKLTRPRSDARDTVDVDVSLWLWQIKELDETHEMLKTICFIRCVWTDEFLQWVPEEFSNVTELVVPAEKIWLPDIFLENSANKLIDSS